MCPDECTGFGNGLKESDSHNALGVMHARSSHGQASPDDHHGRKEHTRLDVI